jgi:hypothetical protein
MSIRTINDWFTFFIAYGILVSLLVIAVSLATVAFNWASQPDCKETSDVNQDHSR